MHFKFNKKYIFISSFLLLSFFTLYFLHKYQFFRNGEEKSIDNKVSEVLQITNCFLSRKRDLKQFEGKKLLAFTFDDGPSNQSTNKLLDNLDKYNARVTFFVLGSRVAKYQNSLKRAYEMGNQIGSHTYSHSNLYKLEKNKIKEEMVKTNTEIKKLIGENVKLLRPPYGNIDLEMKKITNLYTILWDIDPKDWKYKDKERIANNIVKNAHDGGIVLLHDIYMTSVDGALLAMERLEKEGYAFVTIDEMVELKGITLDKNKTYFYFN